MSRPDEPYHDPDTPTESRLWKGIGLAAIAILVAMVLWWAIGLSGDAAEREPGDPATEPLEPATVQPLILPAPEPVVTIA